MKNHTLKKLSLGSIGIALVAVSLGAAAALPVAHTFNKATNQVDDGPVIGHITSITPGSKEFFLDETKVYAGMSCSSMSLIEDDKSSASDTISVDAGTFPITSDDLLQGFNSTTHYTCLKIVDSKGSKTYSTGNIQLTWDGKAYVAMNPSDVVVDYTK